MGRPEQSRRWYLKLKEDPERYRIYRERKRAYGIEWRAKNQGRIKVWNAQNYPYTVRASMYKRKYNLTMDEYDTIFDLQGGCCAICGKHQSTKKRRFAVDHDHKTGRIRGLLCNPCNVFIGYIEEDIAVLEKAIVYLNKNM